MKKFVTYIIQEKVSTYDYRDVIDCDSLSIAKKYLKVLQNKYPESFYRLVRWF